jgi:hypothetical protein
MIRKIILFLLFISVSIGFYACTESSSENTGISISSGFSDYWYNGEAEISSYTLSQARYGEVHEGEAVLIFVTEDFSRAKQVKLDNPESAGKDAVKVLKLNMTKKFNTGIYPYSMMLSVFTPTAANEVSSSLKLTASSQEWCGHTFTQMNRQDQGYKAKVFSYFESVSDFEKDLPMALPEDEIWNMIRLNPQFLPKGEIKIIPGLLAQRLRHTSLAPVSAKTTLAESSDSTQVYSIYYPEEERTFSIEFGTDFPHIIYNWEERYPDGFGKDKKMLTTRAQLDKQLKIDYWNRNSIGDTHWRDSLNLN